MGWVAPKTNWEFTDIFRLEDWMRIVENFDYLYSSIGCTFEVPDGVYKNNYADLPLCSDVNYLESSLLSLYNAAPLVLHEYIRETWYVRTSGSFTHNPSYQDFNRWEEILEAINTGIQLIAGQQNTIVAGMFDASDDRDRQGVRV